MSSFEDNLHKLTTSLYRYNFRSLYNRYLVSVINIYLHTDVTDSISSTQDIILEVMWDTSLMERPRFEFMNLQVFLDNFKPSTKQISNKINKLIEQLYVGGEV